MSIKGATNIIALGVMTIALTGGAAWFRSRESSRENALMVSAIEQGVNHVVAKVEPSAAEPSDPLSEPVNTSPNVDGSLIADVDADDLIAIAIKAETSNINDLVCQNANYEASGAENQSLSSPGASLDIELILLDEYTQKVLEEEKQASAGGYSSSAEATRVGVANSAERLALLFALKDIRESRGTSGNGVKVRFCRADEWAVVTAGAEVRQQVLRARAMRRNEAIRALGDSEVALDGQ